MLGQYLSEDDVVRGSAMTAELIDAGCPLGFAGWVFADELLEWRFYISTPLYHLEGPIAASRLITRFLACRGEAYGFDFTDVKVGPADHTVLGELRNVVSTGGGHEHGGRSKIMPRFMGIDLGQCIIFFSQRPEGEEAVLAARARFEDRLQELEAG